MSGHDELATRRAQLTGAGSAEPPGERDFQSAAVADRAAAARDRLLAAADRQRAAAALADAYRDDLTGTLNRRPGRERMESEIDRAHRASTPLAVIFLDVVGLKRINDSHGHRRGDEVLAAAGTALRTTLRSYDVVMRYGGDEFVCALPGGTEETAVATIARVRRALDELMPGARLRAGYAQLLPTDTLDDVVHRADMALYGRRVYGAADPEAARPRLPSGHSDGAADDAQASLPCGACGGHIAVSEFTLQGAAHMTRAADCSQCGETTLVLLARRTD